MKLGLEHKKALVLGASKGLGAAIAISLANEGVDVVGAARSVEAIIALNRGLQAGATGRIRGIHVDLADSASVTSLGEGVLAEGGVDILINNSGGPAPGEARSSELAAWTSGFHGMVASIIALTQQVLPPWSSADGGASSP